jgi:hypothetical protein
MRIIVSICPHSAYSICKAFRRVPRCLLQDISRAHMHPRWAQCQPARTLPTDLCTTALHSSFFPNLGHAYKPTRRICPRHANSDVHDTRSQPDSSVVQDAMFRAQCTPDGKRGLVPAPMRGNALRCDVDYRARRGFFRHRSARLRGEEGLFLGVEKRYGDECVCELEK